MKPRLLDLFCGAGGAARGYQLAGFHVTGVDNRPQPRYAGDVFVQADAMTYPLDGYDAIHASPPCQAYSAANNIHQRTDHPDLVAATRERLLDSTLPYVIENVPGAPLQRPYLLCGRAFGLGVKRHRLFEVSVAMLVPPCPRGHPGEWVMVFGHTVLGRTPTLGRTAKNGPIFRRPHLGVDAGRTAMGIDWMTRDELSQAHPTRLYRTRRGSAVRPPEGGGRMSKDERQVHPFASDAIGDHRGDSRCGVCGLPASNRLHQLPERDDDERAIEARKVGEGRGGQ
jgi:DNA (cytosine-5)-methyltransferase 1